MPIPLIFGITAAFGLSLGSLYLLVTHVLVFRLLMRG